MMIGPGLQSYRPAPGSAFSSFSPSEEELSLEHHETPFEEVTSSAAAPDDGFEHQDDASLVSKPSAEQSKAGKQSQTRGLLRLPIELLNECFLLARNTNAAKVNHLFRNIHLYYTYPELLRQCRDSAMTDLQCQSALPPKFFRTLTIAIENSTEAKVEAQIAAQGEPPIATVYAEVMDEAKQHNLSEWVKEQRETHSLQELDLVPVMKQIAIDEDQSLIDFFFALQKQLPQVMSPFHNILEDCDKSNAASIAKTAEKLRETLKNNVQIFSRILVLDLSEMDLKSLPKKIAYFSDLRILSLDRNNIKTFPPEIGELKELRRLAISHNQLSYLPEEFAKLTKLNELYIGFNDFSEAPEELQELHDLLLLDIAYNHLSEPMIHDLEDAMPHTDIDAQGNSVPSTEEPVGESTPPSDSKDDLHS